MWKRKWVKVSEYNLPVMMRKRKRKKERKEGRENLRV